jgi:periplasmic protein CpxP/Spy
MNRTVLSAMLAVSLTGFAGAQAPATPPQDGQYPHHFRHQPNPQQEAAHIAKRLSLTPQQEAQLEPILAEREQKMQALRQSEDSITAAQMFQQRREIMKSTEQQLAGVLTPEQMQEMRRFHHGPGGPRGQWQGRQNGEQPGV